MWWKKYTGKDYVSNTTAKNNLVTAIGTLATDRNDCYEYHCSCHGDGTDNSMSRSSPNKENSIDYGEYYQKTKFEGYKGEYQGGAAYYKHCETTAFFMQYLAQLASVKDTATALTLLSEKYNGTRWKFVGNATNIKFFWICFATDNISKKSSELRSDLSSFI